MKRVIYVSMVHEDWANSTRGFTEKLLGLRRLCQRQVCPVNEDRNPLHVVLANEYFFRRSPAEVVSKIKSTYHGTSRIQPTTFQHYRGRKTKNTMYSSSDKEVLISQLCGVSEGKNVLVIPGTMFWIEREPRYKKSFFKSKLQARGVVRNSAFVIYRGNLIKTYHKKQESHELDSFEASEFDFISGVNDGMVDINGLTVGVEVCADHTGSNNLRKMVISNANPYMDSTQLFLHDKLTALTEKRDIGVDVHILLSDGMSMEQSKSAFRKGGCGLHCDSRIPPGVYQKDDSGRMRTVNKESDNFWRLDLVPTGQKNDSFLEKRAELEKRIGKPTASAKGSH